MKRGTCNQKASRRRKIWETTCWLPGSILSVQRLRWRTLEGFSCKRSRHTSRCRWPVASPRSLFVVSRSFRGRARSFHSARGARQNLPLMEPCYLRDLTLTGTPERSLCKPSCRTSVTREAQQREVLPDSPQRSFSVHPLPFIVSRFRYRYRSISQVVKLQGETRRHTRAGDVPRAVSTTFVSVSIRHQSHV
jgi:hypothetical protein